MYRYGLLGSSHYSVYVAAALGLTYSFTFYLAPNSLMDAIAIYCERFQL